MRFKTVARMSAIAGVLFGIAGLAVPGPLAEQLTGTQADALAQTLIRLACSAYVGFAVLSWLARDAADAGAQRAVAMGSAISWGLSGVVVAAGVASGLGGTTAWLVPVLQAAFAVAWALTLVRTRTAALPSAA